MWFTVRYRLYMVYVCGVRVWYVVYGMCGVCIVCMGYVCGVWCKVYVVDD